MSVSLVWLFAIASGLSVANVYYAQPLLDTLAQEFDISHAAVGGMVTATQVGCAMALLFLVPLGDQIDRRRLMALQLLALLMFAAFHIFWIALVLPLSVVARRISYRYCATRFGWTGAARDESEHDFSQPSQSP